ncbi:MAG: trypsin-like peptidase domain-containing protein [Rhodospirillaceae bacterium]|jgi:serine protease Do|nr:trypsin-like peptidase domain-containing protein [Rhodospirillaceae bacterium]MBT5245100.1 trypsin-like peptidase domain-containing protein [Rhodospirillaceae bacterium]MBT5562035.1 trypsin-like peptidase domain-containing protein [Rhodospirillaceae bacterium]MBT6242208.1 trypsin-like peptidase domain-containing protein [Rhodospirillaceae bacterium]
MNKLPSKREQDSVASLVHQTGPSKSTVSWLKGSTLDVSLSPGRIVRVGEPPQGETRDGTIARLHGIEGSYEIEALEEGIVRVNKKPVTSQMLKHGDMIEFGDAGPLSRFRLYQRDKPPKKSISDILSDGLAYLRTSRRPLIQRLLIAFGGLVRRLMSETTLLFRLGVIVAISGLVIVTYQQSRLNVLLQQRLEQSASRLDNVSRALARARSEALTPNDLNDLRKDIKNRISSHADRLKTLERRSESSARVVTESLSAIVFLQGAYGFRETSSGRILRHVVNEEGQLLVSPQGKPLVRLEGNGPVIERKFTGTGFVVSKKGVLITNRHVALPWENDAGTETLANQGLKPEMMKFIFYVSGSPVAGNVELVQASENADLAVLRFINGDGPEKFLPLATDPPIPGDEILVMGYPTGLRLMLAQSGESFIEELQKSGDMGFWSVAAKLAEKSLIVPLVSRGIVGKASETAIVYDAETTSGGSGGPVLDTDGAVVAVNAAIIPEYGGANMGVPASKVRKLLRELKLLPDSPGN